MPIREICNKNVIFVTRNTTLTKAAKLMQKYSVGNLIVADEDDNGRAIPVGIISTRDIVVQVIAKEIEPAEVVVGDIMSPRFITAGGSDSAQETIAKMITMKIRRIAVIDQWNNVIGILSIGDLYKLLAKELEQLVQTTLSQQLQVPHAGR